VIDAASTNPRKKSVSLTFSITLLLITGDPRVAGE
jgi:hypothetical protein